MLGNCNAPVPIIHRPEGISRVRLTHTGWKRQLPPFPRRPADPRRWPPPTGTCCARAALRLGPGLRCCDWAAGNLAKSNELEAHDLACSQKQSPNAGVGNIKNTMLTPEVVRHGVPRKKRNPTENGPSLIVGGRVLLVRN